MLCRLKKRGVGWGRGTTTYAHWDSAKQFRHKCFVHAQEGQGVSVTYGKFKEKTVLCKAACKLAFQIRTEKQTDVNIAVRLIDLAQQNVYDRALIISGDSDLVPAISLTKQIYPDKHVSSIVPIGRRGDEINQVCHSKYKMTEEHLRRSLMEPKMKMCNGGWVLRPAEWVTG